MVVLWGGGVLLWVRYPCSGDLRRNHPVGSRGMPDPEFPEWLQRHPEAGSFWPSWRKASYPGDPTRRTCARVANRGALLCSLVNIHAILHRWSMGEGSLAASIQGFSLIRNDPPVGLYSTTIPRALWWPSGEGAISSERGTPLKGRLAHIKANMNTPPPSLCLSKT